MREISLAGDGSKLNDGRAEIEGVVFRFVASNEFTLNGIPVDGSNALTRDGTAAGLVPGAGAWIEVEGAIENGRIVATEIEIESESSSGDDEFEVTGFVSDFVSAADFLGRNTRIDASQSPRFDGGDPSLLVNGA